MRSSLRLITLLAALLAVGLAGCSTPLGPTPTAGPVLGGGFTPGAATAEGGAGLPTAGPGKQYAAPPPMTIDPSKFYVATFKTEKGDIRVQLFADKAPVTVNNFVFLARDGYYDNTTFHRVLQEFMAQGGDPTGTGGGGPGYQFEDEFHPDLSFDQPGLLAMANSGPDTNGSQFFLTFVPTPHLNGKHTIFGKVVGGMDVLLSLRLRDPQAQPDFLGDRLLAVEIEETGASLLPPPTATPIPVVPVMEDGRPLAKVPAAERANLYTGRPAMEIDPAKTYMATIETTQGDIVVELFPADAPESVNNFVVLAALGYWDDFPIVYVEPETFVLTGSPAGEPTSDIGYTVPAEAKRPNTAGALGYWFREERAASSASQIYLLLRDVPDLDGDFTVFGQITAGQDIAAMLTTEDRIKLITVEAK